MDRFDCQILMATFANVYYFTFARSVNHYTHTRRDLTIFTLKVVANALKPQWWGVLKRVVSSFSSDVMADSNIATSIL